MNQTVSTGPVSAGSAPEETKGPQLSLTDLVNVLQVIRTCAARGAIKAEEMASVGGLYDRLQTFLTSTGVLKPAEESKEPAKE